MRGDCGLGGILLTYPAKSAREGRRWERVANEKVSGPAGDSFGLRGRGGGGYNV